MIYFSCLYCTAVSLRNPWFIELRLRKGWPRLPSLAGDNFTLDAWHLLRLCQNRLAPGAPHSHHLQKTAFPVVVARKPSPVPAQEAALKFIDLPSFCTSHRCSASPIRLRPSRHGVKWRQSLQEKTAPDTTRKQTRETDEARHGFRAGKW